jgi:parvulin-like peptidyl-prolyl isomerase
VRETPKKYAALEQSEPTSKRTVLARVVLGIVAVALLAGMIVQFTPNLASLTGGVQRTDGKTLFSVNGAPVTEQDYERTKQQNQLFGLANGGTFQQDVNNLLMNQLVLVSSARQDASRTNISGGDVSKYITDLRAQRQLTKDSDYTAFVQSNGYNDATFRDAVRQQLQLTKRIEEIQKGVTISDAELKFFYDQNKNNYKETDRILARQIVVDKQADADAIQASLKAGEAFDKLASQKSTIGKEQDGALGAKTGEKVPQPIAEIALPKNIADAAFKLKQGGVTPTISDGGKFYIVKVEKFLPAGVPSFETLKAKMDKAADGKETNKLTEDAKALKGNGAIEAWVKGLQQNAKLEFPKDATLDFYDPAVATVGKNDIKLSELNRSVYSNQQIQQFLQQGAQGATLVEQFFKPQSLDNLINQEVAVQAAKKSGQPFFGAGADILQQIQNYQSKDTAITDADVKKYYNDNIATYTTPASADIQEASFKTLEQAKAFRTAFIAGGTDFTKDAAKQKGTVTETGSVTPESVNPAYKKVLFDAKALTKAGALQVSDVIANNKQFIVVGVKSYIEKSVKPFTEVAADAKEKALIGKRAVVGQKWLTDTVKAAKPVKKYDDVRKQLELRAKKADADKAAADAKRKAELEKQNKTTPTTPGTTTPTTTPTTPTTPITPPASK